MNSFNSIDSYQLNTLQENCCVSRVSMRSTLDTYFSDDIREDSIHAQNGNNINLRQSKEAQRFSFTDDCTVEDYEKYLLKNYNENIHTPQVQIELDSIQKVEKPNAPTELTCKDYKYYGDYKYENRHGFGICKFSNGDSYTGRWKYDQMHGLGRLETESGIFSGEFRQNIPDGFIEFTSKEGLTYQGIMKGYQFIKDEPVTISNDKLKVEMVVENNLHKYHKAKTEESIILDNDDDSAYEPEFPDYSELNLGMDIDEKEHFRPIQENKTFPILIGIGYIQYSNGNLYLGNIKNIEQYGLGIYKKDTMTFQGYKEVENYNGLCEVIYKDGTKFCGNFSNNKRHGLSIFYNKKVFNLCQYYDGVKDGFSLSIQINSDKRLNTTILDLFSLGWRTTQIIGIANISEYLELYSPGFLPILNLDYPQLIVSMEGIKAEV